MSVEFFSMVDKADGPTGKGQIASTLPAWYFEKNIRDLEDDIRKTKRRLEVGQIPHNRETQIKTELRLKEKKLDSLKNAKPDIQGPAKDLCAAVYKELSSSIKEAMYTRTEDQKGLVDASVLADRMSKPCIKVSDKVAEMALKNGLPVSKDGKMSMTDASIIWKINARLLEQNSNVESLRRDK